ncbi:hypothetical protein KI387_012531, partial [Taxus chinensis]
MDPVIRSEMLDKNNFMQMNPKEFYLLLHSEETKLKTKVAAFYCLDLHKLCRLFSSIGFVPYSAILLKLPSHSLERHIEYHAKFTELCFME